jgi:hypothetical protein
MVPVPVPHTVAVTSSRTSLRGFAVALVLVVATPNGLDDFMCEPSAVISSQ